MSNIERKACTVGVCLDTMLLFEIKAEKTVVAFWSNDLPTRQQDERLWYFTPLLHGSVSWG